MQVPEQRVKATMASLRCLHWKSVSGQDRVMRWLGRGVADWARKGKAQVPGVRGQDQRVGYQESGFVDKGSGRINGSGIRVQDQWIRDQDRISGSGMRG